MEMWCDGGCSNNGFGNPNLPVLGGAGVYYPRALDPSLAEQSFVLPGDVDQGVANATSNRAELYAILQALETVYKAKETLRHNPRLHVTVHTDNKNAQEALSFRWQDWAEHGWTKKSGAPVANVDLLRQIIDLQQDLNRNGDIIIYVAIRREKNWPAHFLADRAVEDAKEHYWNATRGRYYREDSFF